MPGMDRDHAGPVTSNSVWLLADPDLHALQLHIVYVAVDRWSSAAGSSIDLADQGR